MRRRPSSRELVRVQPNQPATVASSDRDLNREIAKAQRAGIVAAARINSGAFATSVAIHHAAVLSQATDTAFRISPMGENVYRTIFTAFGNFAANEINLLAFHEGGQD
jgi:hypothetical protein